MPPRSLPAAAFEDVAFWDARYSVDDEAFDWYEAPSIGVAVAAIERALSGSSCSTSSTPSAASAAPSPTLSGASFSLLDIGCGTSLLAKKVSEREGSTIMFGRIVACDASEVAIEKQRQRQAERRQGEKGDDKQEQPDASSSSSSAAAAAVAVSYEVADAFGLPYGDSSFDAVVDKGTADALDCGGCDAGGGGDEDEDDDGDDDDERASPSSFPPAARVIAEASRVLKPGGVFVMVSCREPERRKRDFAKARKMALNTAAAAGEQQEELVLSSLVGEIRKGAKDPCPNAHVYVAVKSRSSLGRRGAGAGGGCGGGGGGAGEEEEEGEEGEQERAERQKGEAARARELADAAAASAAAAAAASAAES